MTDFVYQGDRLRRLRQRGLAADGALLLDPATLDEAIVGVLSGRAVYDRNRLVELFAGEGGDVNGAEEHVAYNVDRMVPYYAELGGPILVEPWDDEMAEILGAEDEIGLWKIEISGRQWITADEEVVKLARRSQSS